VQVPDVDGSTVPARDPSTPPKYRAGWVCENPKCTRRYDLL
jgi:hypothetical protein